MKVVSKNKSTKLKCSKYFEWNEKRLTINSNIKVEKPCNVFIKQEKKHFI